MFLSFVTVAEMLYGAELKTWGTGRRSDLDTFLGRYQLFWADEVILDVWIRMHTAMTRAGRKLDDFDSWIAATALANDLTLITHDRAFRSVPGLKVICYAPS